MMAIIKEVPSAVALIVEKLPGWLSEIGAAIQANLPDMLNSIANVLGLDIESTLQAPIVQSVLALGDRISEAFSQVFGDIDLSQTLADIQTGLSDLGDFLKWVFDSASIEISKFLDSIDTASLAQGFETLRAVGSGLMSILKSVGEIAVTIFQKVLLPILSHLWDLWTSTIWPGLQEIFTLLQPILMTIGDMLVTGFDWLSKIAAIIGDVLGPVIDALFAWLGPKISQLIDNIKFVLTLLGEDFKRTWAIVKPIVDIFIGTMLSAFRNFGPELERLKNTFMSVFNAIRSIVSGVVSSIIGTVSGIAGNIAGAFWNAVSGISAAFSNVYNIITAPFRAAFQAIRRLWNSTIGGFSFSVPSWIPGVGGRSFRIPRLATGGDITTPGTVMVGEAGPELLSLPRGARVTPLSDAAPQGATYSVVVGDVDLSDDDQVRRVTREYLEFLARLAAPTSMVTA
jgi:phage-related protein